MTGLNVHTDMAAVARRRITFASEGIELVGDLRLPGDGALTGAAGADGAGLPAVVLTGPFTGVKEQVTGSYAELLAAAGFATLAFDHRGFGESGGRRQHEDSQGKLADLRAAVGAIAGGYNSPAAMAASMGIAQYRTALGAALDRYDSSRPAVASDGGEAAMGGDEPDAYYGTPRSRSPHWRNEVTRGSLHSLMTFDALSAADLLADTPLLIIHGERDAYCSPALAQAVYDRAPGDKEIQWLDVGLHTDLYDNQPYVSQAVAAAAAFFRRRLSA